MAAGHCASSPFRTLLSILLLIAGEPPTCGADVDFFKTPDIVLEYHDGGKKRWVQLPEPFFRAGDPRPYPPREDYGDARVRNSSTVVVLVAALRETRVVATLQSLFKEAWLPSRVHAGVVQQNAPEDGDALEELCKLLGAPLRLRESFQGRSGLHLRQDDEDLWGQERYTPESLAACEPAQRVRMFRMASSDAKGPVFARSRQPLLISEGAALEDFCMQIDAHTRFTPGWDDKLIKMWAETENEYAVLSTYPTGADAFLEDGTLPNVNNHWEMPYLCEASLLGPGIVRNSIAGAAANLLRPPLSKFWAAGLSFSKCHAERDVPNDPALLHIFDGEEFGRAVRLYTNGYDLYGITRPVVGTYYGKHIKSKGGWSRNVLQGQRASRRLATLLKHHQSNQTPEARAELRGFDLGTRRSLQDYLDLTGIDTVHQRTNNTPCAVRSWKAWQSAAQPPYGRLEGAPGLAGVDIAHQLGVTLPSKATNGRHPPSVEAPQGPQLPSSATLGETAALILLVSLGAYGAARMFKKQQPHFLKTS